LHDVLVGSRQTYLAARTIEATIKAAADGLDSPKQLRRLVMHAGLRGKGLNRAGFAGGSNF
jgi:hypothetical protein